jgi:poly(3-hydroxybutyrate) depolymerase
MKNTLLFLALTFTSTYGQAAQKQLNLDLEHISVSGLSSGGYMANQFHVAHSDWVNKVGIIAGGPYYCAQGSIKTALEQCVNKVVSPIDLESLTQSAEAYAEEKKISSLAQLKKSRVWLFHGTKDDKVVKEVSQALYQQYAKWSGEENVAYVDNIETSHLFPTLNYGSDCQESVSPYLGNCQYDAAGAMLGFLFGKLAPREMSPQGQLLELDQQKLGGPTADVLADKAFAYVPQSCAKGESCSLHISFHGCNQNAQSIGQQFVEHTGLNNWADSNHMVVLYPQTKNSTFMPLNPQGCWDWWGYADPDYATQSGKQIQAITQMANSLQHYSLQ